MRLQKQVSRKLDGKEYAKYVVVISPDRVEELGWKEGQELEDEVEGRKLVIYPKTNMKRDNREIGIHPKS